MTPGIVGESDLSGNLTDEYVFFDGERVARKSTNGVFYYFSDHLKTASVITDSAGNIKANRIIIPGAASFSSSTTIPTITSSPAKNGIRNATRLFRGEVLLEWAGTVGHRRLEPNANAGAVCRFQ